ncbi:DUF3397 domain-containing protein [Oceanobacillus alkalisoli]|uniref:DUF3397 domain-containing protein n=1 Tax=Oceanobacillus alkalisoli TaxID=2925113 RepID=UPI001EE425BB|nr:DUF3397 domain-containing protein [Oceanobacillus alkalisoli]MCG5103585.1 DUF3397 domain-containing protein [Oceanobacillus alkalisoli]
MLDIIVYVLSFFITIPLLASFLVYIISMIRERNKLKAFHSAVNWTTILYIIAVTIMLGIIFDRSFVGVVLIFLLISLSLIIFIQWRTGRDVQFKKAAKLLWRISFLLFFILYGCLMIAGIIKYLAT